MAKKKTQFEVNVIDVVVACLKKECSPDEIIEKLKEINKTHRLIAKSVACAKMIHPHDDLY